MSSPVPPSNGSPPTLPAKSITTRSPLLALWLRRRVFPALARARQLLELRVDRLVVDVDSQPLELQILDLRRGNVGQGLEADPDLGVLARLVFLVELDLGLQRRTHILLGQQLLDAVLDRAVERVALERVAVHLLDQIGGHLARAEAGHAHLRRKALHLRVHPRLDVLGGNGQHEGALQALILGLDGLDGHVFNFPTNSDRLRDFRARHPPDALCAEMVRAEGLEPPHLSILEPKSSASTSSATRARPKRCAAYSKDRAARQPAATAEAQSLGHQGDRRCNKRRPRTRPAARRTGATRTADRAAARNAAASAEHRRSTPPSPGPNPRRRRFHRWASAVEPGRSDDRFEIGQDRLRNNATGPHRAGSDRACC